MHVLFEGVSYFSCLYYDAIGNITTSNATSASKKLKPFYIHLSTFTRLDFNKNEYISKGKRLKMKFLENTYFEKMYYFSQ